MSKTVVALGFFDGVHIAHQKIIQSAVDFANDAGLTPVALTFDKSPVEILTDLPPRYITNNEEKTQLIEKLGAETEFLAADKELLSMTPEEFVRDILISKLGTRHAVCGYNYRFGKNGSGDTATLIALGEKYGFSVCVCDKVSAFGEDVSSSRIRELIADGNISLANKLLGHNFSVKGMVTEGKHLGQKLGFPTANVFFPENSATPLCGVYQTMVTVNDNKFPAITNVGINPTVGGEKMRSETYIPDFSEDIYGEEIKIEFIDFIRKETKFESVELLKKQINKDVQEILNNRRNDL